MAKSEKLSSDDVIGKIQAAAATSNFVFSDHANERMAERNISYFEVKDVLLNGFNERKKDEYKEEYGNWNYSIRFDIKVSDEEKRRLRIPVAFDEDGTIVISTIDIDQNDSV